MAWIDRCFASTQLPGFVSPSRTSTTGNVSKNIIYEYFSGVPRSLMLPKVEMQDFF